MHLDPRDDDSNLTTGTPWSSASPLHVAAISILLTTFALTPLFYWDHTVAVSVYVDSSSIFLYILAGFVLAERIASVFAPNPKNHVVRDGMRFFGLCVGGCALPALALARVFA